MFPRLRVGSLFSSSAAGGGALMGEDGPPRDGKGSATALSPVGVARVLPETISDLVSDVALEGVVMVGSGMGGLG